MASRDTTLAELRAEALELRRKTGDKPLYIDGEVSAQLARIIGISVLRAGLDFLKARLGGETQAPAPLPLQPAQPIGAAPGASPAPEPEVMTADQVAAFLGVDRNTVYE